MVAVPAETPVTMPERDPTLATVVALLVQVPPGMASPNVIVCPTHTPEGPLMGPGVTLTVTTRVV